MPTLDVELGHSRYSIHIGAGLYASLPQLLPKLVGQRVILITNPTVSSLYGTLVASALRGADLSVDAITVPDGEAYKNLETLYDIQTHLLQLKAERNTTLIALGGGVIGDLAGFAAAVYQRGIAIIQIPTTLLAQVDSSVGGKTGVNHPLGKNMIGAFKQPLAVIIDTDTLRSLPDRELVAGLAEVIKYGLIRDAAFFDWLEANIDALRSRDPIALQYAIFESCRNKAEVVQEDEFETGSRALLNLGHTFGHAIEAALGFGTWLHGEAVGAGMVMAAKLSGAMGFLGRDQVERVMRLIGRAGLSTQPPIVDPDRMIELMRQDKKVADGAIRFVLLKGIGEAFVCRDVSMVLLRSVLTG